MNSKKPIPDILPQPSDISHTTEHIIANYIKPFTKAGMRKSLLLLALGLVSLAAGIAFLIWQLSSEFLSSVPAFFVFGAGFITLGTWNLYHLRLAFRLVSDQRNSIKEYLDRIASQIRVLRHLRVLCATAVAVGICGLLLSCLSETIARISGAWATTTGEASILTVAILLITYKLEIHSYEVERRFVTTQH